MTMAIKIGDTLHHFDTNRRQYTAPAPGREWGDLIYAEHFTAHVIVGETTGAWIVESGYGRPQKVGRRLIGKGVWFTDAGKADHLWVYSHRYKLRELLDRATADQLRAVADVLGYRES
jgi:hypothetical protein